MNPVILNRIVAKLIDLFIVLLVAAILPRFLGPLIGFCYSILADGLQVGGLSGQSIGKKLMGLQVVHLETRKPANYRDSVIRNAPVGFATFFAIIPIWGWIILFLVGFPLMLIEIYLMFRIETGHRLGDVMADTEVVALSNEESPAIKAIKKRIATKKKPSPSSNES